MGTLLALAAIFAQLSLLAFGGGNTILPEMQRQVTQVHPWLTPQEFAALFALAQAAPGPNMLISTLIGWRIAGLAGAGLGGIEVFHFDHDEATRAALTGLARSLNLIMTGGSDDHGSFRPGGQAPGGTASGGGGIGAETTPRPEYERLLALAGQR